MGRHVDAAVFELLFELLHVDPYTKLSDSGDAISVAAGRHDNGLERNPGVGGFEGCYCQRGLCQREPAAARTNAY